MKSTTKIWISAGLTLSVIAAAIWFFSGWHGGFDYDGYGRGFMPYHTMAGNGMGFAAGGMGMGLVMILFWVIVVVVLAFVVAGLLGGRSINRCETAPEPDALEILKRRYARGEIDQSEYEQKKRELT